MGGKRQEIASKEYFKRRLNRLHNACFNEHTSSTRIIKKKKEEEEELSIDELWLLSLYKVGSLHQQNTRFEIYETICNEKKNERERKRKQCESRWHFITEEHIELW